MTTEITVQQPEQELDLVPQFHAVAVNATEMANAKAGIQTWLINKLAQINDEIESAQGLLERAVKYKLKQSSFKNQLAKHQVAHLYYGKLLAACQAGFTIVPNMPMDVFAIRVIRGDPKWKVQEGSSFSGFNSAAPYVEDEKEQILPAHRGRYESPITKFSEDRVETKVLRDGKDAAKYEVTQYCEGYDKIDFPLAIAHPIVMDATMAAMAHRIFDRIGIVGPTNKRKGYRGDPIVIGQIVERGGWNPKTASFLIAWYLDPRTL